MRKLRFFLSLLILFTFSLGILKAADVVVTLDNIGTDLGSTANTEMATTTITATGTETNYTLNYFQCKKQGNSMLMTKSVNPFISNATAMPGNIKSVEVFINSGASGKTNYDVAFSTTACTTAVGGIGAVNIGPGESHVFSNMDGDDIKVAGRYFCITLGNANNGQVLKIVVTCEGTSSNTPSLSVEQNGSAVSALDFGDVKEDTETDGYGYSAIQAIDIKGSKLNGNVKLEITEAGGGTFSIWREGAASTHEYIIAANEGAIDTSIVIAAYTKSTGLKEGNLQISSLASTADFTTLDIDLAINLKQLEDPTITFNNGNVETGYSVDLDTLFASNSPGEVTYTITSGSAYASLSGSILTGIAEGSVTIEANQATASYFNAATATCTIGVTTHVITPGTYKFVPNNTFWGCEVINKNNAAANEINFVGSTNDIQVEIDNNSKPNAYINGTQTRVYDSYTMQFSVPSGFVITAIAFIPDGSNWAGAHTADVGEMTNNKNWAGNAHSVTITFAGTCRIDSIAVTYEAEPAILAPNILGENPFYPSASISMSCATDGATIHYTLNGNDPTISDAVYSDTPIEITATTTFKAIAIKGSDQSDITERTFTKGTLISVAEAIELIPNNGNTANDQFVKGVVCTAGETVSSGKMTYHISDDGTENNRLQVYLGKGLNNTDFADATDLKVGDTVVVYGQLKNYNGTHEFNSGNYIVEYAESTGVSAELAWSAEADTIYQYRSYTLPILSNPNGLTVTYESTNESVATIDEYGEVTIVGGGQTTIRASFAGGDGYLAQTVEYTLTYATLMTDICLGGELTNKIFEVGTTASEITDLSGLGVVANYTDGSYYIIPDEEITWTVELQYSGSTAIEVGMTKLIVTAEWNGNESNTKECIIGVKVHEVTWNPNPETFASIALLYGGSIQETGDINMYKGDEAEVVVNITDGIHKLATLTANGEDILATKTFTVDTTDIEIIATFAEKAEADIAWSADADTAYTVGLDYDLPTLINNNGVVVGYSSSNENVATIDNDGTITLVAAGETVIKAIFGGDDDYKPAEVSYTLTVAAPAVLALRGNLSVTEYEKGDLFNRDGIQAYAIYSDYAELEVTNLATWTINNQDEVAVNETDVYYVAAVWEGIGSGNAAYNVSVKTHKVSIAETPEHGSLVITDGNNPIAEGVEFAKGTKLYVVATPDEDYKFVAFDFTGAAEAGDDWFIVGVEDIAVSVIFDEKASTNLEWSADQATVTIGGDDNIFPTLYNPANVTITYSSSNEDVAAIDETSGAITLVAAGTATITATFAGDDTYKFMEISYDLTVQNKPDDPTGINQTSAESKTVKMIENNHVVIIKNGIRYNAIGVKIQ